MPPDLKLLFGLAKDASETSVGRAAVRGVARLLEEVTPRALRASVEKALDKTLPTLEIVESESPKLVHVSRQENLADLRNVDPGSGTKPNGLWFSPDHAWAKSGIEQYSQSAEGYAFLVDSSQANIFRVAKAEDLQALHAKYGVMPDKDWNMIPSGIVNKDAEIDWRKLARDYDGIHVENFGSGNDLPYWYRELDVTSGAVWNASKLKLTPMGKMPHSEMSGEAYGDGFASLLYDHFDFAKKQDFDANYLKLLEQQLKSAGK